MYCVSASFSTTFNLSLTAFKMKAWNNKLIYRGELCRLQVTYLYIYIYISHVYIGLICCGFILATLRMSRINYERVESRLNSYPDNISKRAID